MGKLSLPVLCCVLPLVLVQAQADTPTEFVTVYGLQQESQLNTNNMQAKKYMLQIGAFNSYSNAVKYKTQIENKIKLPVHISALKGTVIKYRILIGPIADAAYLAKVRMQLSAVKTDLSLINELDNNQSSIEGLPTTNHANTSQNALSAVHTIPLSDEKKTRMKNPEFPEVSSEYVQATEALKKGDNNAIAMYQKAIAQNSKDKTARIGLIKAAIDQKKYDLAIEQLALYKQEFGEDDRYLTEQAHYLSQIGKAQDALVILNSLLKKNPSSDTLLDIKNFVVANPNGAEAAPLVQAPAPVAAAQALPVQAPIPPSSNALADASAPVGIKALEKTSKLTNSYVEAGVEYDQVTNDYGNWFNQYLKGFVQVDPKNAWFGEFYHDSQFYQVGDYAKVEQTHIFNEDIYSMVSVGLSDNTNFIPKYYLGGTIFVKQLKRKQLVGYLGAHAYWWRPNNSTEDINPGFVYYFEKPWILEAGAYINRSNPGVVYSATGYVAVTQGREKEHYITLRYGFGKEAYLPLDSVGALGYPSNVFTLTWRQWIGQDWGVNIRAESYNNPFYSRRGGTFGLFKDISI